jgi:hypothetical protein
MMWLGFNGWGLFPPWFRQTTGAIPSLPEDWKLKKKGMPNKDFDCHPKATPSFLLWSETIRPEVKHLTFFSWVDG